jgi:AcrR family transcriptional regulator
VSERVDPRVEQSKALVRAAAEEAFLEGGFTGVTVDGVAARSGVARSTIYRHWPNRDALLAEVLGSFTVAIAVPPRDLGVEERLRLVVRQLAAVLADERWRRALPAMLDAMVQHRNELLVVMAATQHAQQRALTTVVADAIADGELPAGTDRLEVMRQLMGPLTVAAMFTPTSLDDALADRVVALLLAGRSALGTGAPHH